MANFQVQIYGDELNELNTIVQEIQKENPGLEMTGSQYLTNVCLNFLTPRVRDILIHEARTAPLSELKEKLGDPVEIKARQKSRGVG